MTDAPATVNPPSGLTFRIAVGLLGCVLVVEVASIAWSLATRTAPGMPPRVVDSRPEADDVSGDAGSASAEDMAAMEQRLIATLGARERIGVESGGTGGPDLPAIPPRAGSDIDDPAARELYEIGRTLRKDGDMQGALVKFREADARRPGNPRILYEIASAFDTMGLTDKATPYWTQIRELGPDSAGDAYAIADLKLLGQSEAPPMRPMTVMYVNQALAKEHPEVTNGEQVTIRLALKAREGAPIDVEHVYVDARFYDITTGGHIEPSPANPMRWEWMTAPADWKDQSEEVLDLVYFQPGADPAAEEATVARRYYGFLVKLYYRDVLQDLYSEPRTLVDEIMTAPAGVSAGDSLFPQD